MAACQEENHDEEHRLRVLELYSGIGGTHWAFKESGLAFEVVAAVDINNVANDIYKHNFPETNLMQKVIEALDIECIDRLQPDVLTMSPPCQPFTRVGLQRDTDDPRTKSFLHVLDILPKLKHPPSCVFLENVKGFETSATHHRLCETLTSCGYVMQEFLLTPNQFGVPNSRLRYYMLAKKADIGFSFPTKAGVREDLPSCAEPLLKHKMTVTPDEDLNEHTQQHTDKLNGTSQCGRSVAGLDSTAGGGDASTERDSGVLAEQDRVPPSDPTPSPLSLEEQPRRTRYEALCRPLSHYLEQVSAEQLQSLMVPDKLLKRFWSMDIVKPSARNCCCFTKSYHHHVEATGSILQTAEDVQDDPLAVYKEKRAPDETTLAAARLLKLRFFSPREVANLMCFPPAFEFPTELTPVQRYRVLGNSLNVHVVAVLLFLLCQHGSCKGSHPAVDTSTSTSDCATPTTSHSNLDNAKDRLIGPT